MAIQFDRKHVSSGFSSIDVLNENFENLETALRDAFSLMGNIPNTLSTNVDMNGHRIVNLPEPQSDHEAARRIDLQDVEGPQGPEGPPGPQGSPGVFVGQTPPEDTTLIWFDTSGIQS